MKQQRFILLFLLFASGMTYHARAQDTLVVSERVGKVIDLTEHRYFQLFPFISYADDIVIIEDGNNRMMVLAEGREAKHLDSAQFHLLGNYIDNYEVLYRSARIADSVQQFSERYQILVVYSIVKPLQQWQGRSMQIIHGTGDGRADTLKGELLWADDDGLVLRPEFTSIDSEPEFIRPANIVSIEMYRKDLGRGALVGGLFGGGMGFLFVVANAAPKWDVSQKISVAGVFAALGMAVGAILGYVATAASEGIHHHHKIEDLEEYYLLLPKLQKSMYYRNGLPPDSPWREK